ncbi:hypothetical protein L1049_004801 [Liquidambar formosana]|uniref:DUSP domain-containing protein n=1 Tax=Liquidambar formosana TaxID=63359 RepID=A0AAP0RNR8_LIQFO
MAEMSACSSSSDLTPEEERLMIRDIVMAAEANTKEGDTFYLIIQRWWQYWLEYVNQDQPVITNNGSYFPEHCDSVGSSTLKRPSAIDNSDLIYDSAPEDSTVGMELH